MGSDHPALSIGQVAQRTGLSIHALRFYEREGLLVAPVSRDPSGRRCYDAADLEWLQICISLRASGMPLDTIRHYAQPVRDGPGNEGERLALLQAHQTLITTQIAELQRCLELIDHKVSFYKTSIQQGTAQKIWSPYRSQESQPVT
jgi:DNA-binding transcriptional MerR regulator